MIRKLRILEVVFSESWGGLEMNACNFALNFKALGHDIRMVSPSDTRISLFCNERGIPHTTLKPRLKYLDFLTAWNLSNIIKEQAIDVVHSHISKDLSTLTLAKMIAGGAKLVFTQHMDSRYPKEDMFHRWVYKHVDRIATVTQSVRQHVLEYSTATHNQVVCIYNGVDLQKFSRNSDSAVRKKFNIPPKAHVVGHVGRLDRHKKQELLVEAAPVILTLFPNTFFFFVGEETPGKTGRGYKDELVRMIEQKNLSSHFNFIGFTQNVTEVTSIFDIAVLTTPKETFGMVLIEAMAMGIPVVGTHAGGVLEIIDEGINGLLYEPDDPQGLSTCIINLLGSKKLRRAMGREGRKKVRSTFDLNEKLNEYERLFYSTIAPSFQ